MIVLDLPRSLCGAPDCDRAATRRGMCQKHYQRWMKYGVTELPPRPSLVERFWSYVDKSGACWLWTGGIRGEYGFFNVRPTTVLAHRMSYELANGPIPGGLVVDHICHVKLCVNPGHLQTATVSENGQNHSGPTRRSSSGIRGVWWDRTNRKWVGQAAANGRTYSAGHHDTKAAAAEAVVALRNRIHTNNLPDRKGA